MSLQEEMLPYLVEDRILGESASNRLSGYFVPMQEELQKLLIITL